MINAQGVEFIDENGGGCGRDPGKAKRKARKAHKRPCSKSNAMKLFRALVISALFVAAGALSHADPLPGVHYAPAENLEHIDVGLTDGAKHEIDFAAYALTDWPIMQALTRAADRGVKIRIYLDGTQFAEREPTKVFEDLAHTPGVEIRVKRENSASMHLKSYEIDGQLLRTGAVNFSASGEKRQDNDLVVINEV
jgi:phosphatidylserine/phosphatidylglycerophosphate/cardiolipin synthase-like enzyme